MQAQAPIQARAPTAEVPLMDGRRLEMLKVVDASDSTAYLSMILPNLAKDAEAHRAALECTNMENMLQDKDGRTSGLLDHIQPAVLESLISGTLAWDHEQGVFNEQRKHRDSELPGTYAASVHIDGRKGAWMTAAEMLVVRDHLHDYIRGAEHFFLYHGWQDPSLHRHVRRLDGMVGSANLNGPPKWATGAGGVERLKAFQETLERMAVESLKLDPAGGARLRQCPIYVGCSSGPMKESYEMHQNLEDKSLQMNKLLGVLVCCMKMESLHPKVLAMPVVPVFEQMDLPLSEILVTGLARSMCVMDGFNCTGPGANTAMIEPALLAKSLSVLDLAGDLLERAQRSNLQMEAHLQEAENKKLLKTLEKEVSKICQRADALVAKNKECWDRRAVLDQEMEEMRRGWAVLDAETAAMKERTARILAALEVLGDSEEESSHPEEPSES
ncbi:hypothetical protein RB595_002051 [Gaeumannomyces hyphopodioides]